MQYVEIAIVAGILYLVYSLVKGSFGSIKNLLQTKVESLTDKKQSSVVSDNSIDNILEKQKDFIKLGFEYKDPELLDIQNSFNKKLLKNIQNENTDKS